MKFEWDINKAKSNKSKHRVSFDEGSTVFDDDFTITILDEEHSIGEERFITMVNLFRDVY